MNIILFDPEVSTQKLRPFTFLRPISEIKMGIMTIAQKWDQYQPSSVSPLPHAYLAAKYPTHYQALNHYVAGNIIPDQHLISTISSMQKGQSLVDQHGQMICFVTDKRLSYKNLLAFSPEEGSVTWDGNVQFLEEKWQIFQWCRQEIIRDFALLTNGRQSAPLDDPHTIVYGRENLFIEPGAKIRAAIINAEKGPVYIGKDAQIHEGAIITGAFALGQGAHINQGAKIKGDTSIGAHCKIGGEVSNSVFFDYSNKGHEGFVGNSVIAEWCNLGADTNTSNLKNNYGEIKIWDYAQHRYLPSGQTFCGLMMGDHSKSGINTMFNTGTVVGVAANIFDSGFPPKFVPSFSWGGKDGFETFRLEKCFEVAERMMQRRNIELTQVDRQILEEVMAMTVIFRA